jgi:type IV pilus assembly protein PilC
MPTYAYDAINNAGKKTSGTIEATTADEALKKIRSQGLFPSGVKEQKVSGGTGGGGAKAVRDVKKKKKGLNFSIGGVSTKKLTLFTRQLSTLQDAGLPLLRSLQILESQQKPGALKNVIQGVCEEVESGTSLSESMAKFPRAFDRLYTKMVAAGEVGGVLDVILQRLADFME